MKRFSLLLGLYFYWAVSTAFAAIPRLINFQGVLRDTGGNPVADGAYSVSFKIYTGPTGGTLLWTETQLIFTYAGSFSVLLGASNPVVDSVFKGTDRFLGIAVASDPELSPRFQLVSIGYAYRVNSVDGALGGNITSKVSIGPGHINTGTDAFVAGAGGIASGAYSTVGGGAANTASNEHATVSGGGDNTASGMDATVGGGITNRALGDGSTIGGGVANIAAGTGELSTVGGGGNNKARGRAAVVSGGGGGASDSNSAIGDLSAIGGGRGNIALGFGSKVGGGSINKATGSFSFVGGGISNLASGSQATVAGGQTNTANAPFASVVGGCGNSSQGSFAAAGGGFNNQASGFYSAVAGGDEDTATGDWSAIPGGQFNKAAGNYSFAAGRRAKALHQGAFVWADSTDADFSSTAPNQFLIRASGGVGIGTTNPQGALDMSNAGGAFIAPRMTTAQRNALTAIDGMIIYNVSTKQFNYCENGAWVTKQSRRADR